MRMCLVRVPPVGTRRTDNGGRVRRPGPAGLAVTVGMGPGPDVAGRAAAGSSRPSHAAARRRTMMVPKPPTGRISLG